MGYATIIADAFPACNSSLWSHVNGWEVVTSVFFIMGAWALNNVARMYFMVKMAETRHNKCTNTPHGESPPNATPPASSTATP